MTAVVSAFSLAVVSAFADVVFFVVVFFAAGFVSEILRGAGEKEALDFANACGAICTTAAGAGTALKSREQVLGFMRENGKNIPAEEKSPS